jgi:hypothetical protein
MHPSLCPSLPARAVFSTPPLASAPSFVSLPRLAHPTSLDMANIGIPTKLLHESLGHVISVELKTGQVYRGKLFDGESAGAIPHESGMA